MKILKWILGLLAGVIGTVTLLNNNKSKQKVKTIKKDLKVSKKKVNEVQNIFLHDEGDNLKNLSPDLSDSSVTTIIAGSGYIDKTKFLLFDGQIISTKLNQEKNKVIKFEQMNLELKGLDTSTIKKPKIQETSTIKLLDCFIYKNENGIHTHTNKQKAYNCVSSELNNFKSIKFKQPKNRDDF